MVKVCRPRRRLVHVRGPFRHMLLRCCELVAATIEGNHNLESGFTLITSEQSLQSIIINSWGFTLKFYLPTLVKKLIFSALKKWRYTA